MARGDVLFRQWELIRALQAHRFGISTEDLARRLECNKRTVQRDLGVLQDIFPIQFETRDRGKRFWTLDHTCVLSDQLQLTMTELLGLCYSQKLALPMAGTQWGDGYQGAIEKIKATLPGAALAFFEALDDSFLVRHTAHIDYAPHDRTIRALNQAIKQMTAVRLRYMPAGGTKCWASVFHAYGMMLHQSTLYCVGYLATADAIRTLRIDRIASVAALHQPFTRPSDFRLSDHFTGAFGVIQEGKPQRIVTEFSGWAAVNVREIQWHPSQRIVEDRDGKITAHFEITSTHEFKRWILGYGRFAQVLSPASLVDEVRVEVQAMLEVSQ